MLHDEDAEGEYRSNSNARSGEPDRATRIPTAATADKHAGSTGENNGDESDMSISDHSDVEANVSSTGTATKQSTNVSQEVEGRQPPSANPSRANHVVEGRQQPRRQQQADKNSPTHANHEMEGRQQPRNQPSREKHEVEGRQQPSCQQKADPNNPTHANNEMKSRQQPSTDLYPGLAQPFLNTGQPVTGANKKEHRRENKRVRINRQLSQTANSFWSTHMGDFKVPSPKAPTVQHHGGMCPSGLALHHPAAGALLQYATEGCPTMTGKPWTKQQLEAAVARGPHASAMIPEVMRQFQEEARTKEKQGQCRLIYWDEICTNPPDELKVSPIAAAPHKSRMWRAILDLSFTLRLKDGSHVPAVNDTSTKLGPSGAVDQMGHALTRIIHAFAEADDDAKIFMAKWDIKDGFWRLNSEAGEEYNFAYVLPQKEGERPILVIPTSLQMGWIESPTFFCAASETGRDVAQQYIETEVGSLPNHKFLRFARGSDAYNALPRKSDAKDLRYLMEVYVDDYISLAIPTSQQQLDHCANAMQHGVHDVFPSDKDPNKDPLAFKKMERGDSKFDVKKDILGFDFDGETKTLWLEHSKRETILTTLASWVRRAKLHHGTPWTEFVSVTAKLRHAFISIPAAKGLLSPINKLLAIEPPTVYFHRNRHLLEAIVDCRALLRESTVSPTRCRELVAAWPDYVGVKDASGEGVGGVIIGENKACPPTVFRLQWPQDIKDDLVSDKNPKGRITNSDLEMAGLLLLFLIMEAVCIDLGETHIGLYSDNSPTVSWVRRLASRHSVVAAQLVRALTHRMKAARTSPLTPFHIRGIHNAMTDIPSRSWGSEPGWNCANDDELLTLFNTKFPLPNQASWTVFHPSSEISMRVISVLRHEPSTMDEWRRLPPIGKNIGTIGAPTSHLWEWTLSYRMNRTKKEFVRSEDSQREFERGGSVTESKSELDRYLRLSQPLERRVPWPTAPTQQNKSDQGNSPQNYNK